MKEHDPCNEGFQEGYNQGVDTAVMFLKSKMDIIQEQIANGGFIPELKDKLTDDAAYLSYLVSGLTKLRK